MADTNYNINNNINDNKIKYTIPNTSTNTMKTYYPITQPLNNSIYNYSNIDNNHFSSHLTSFLTDPNILSTPTLNNTTSRTIPSYNPRSSDVLLYNGEIGDEEILQNDPTSLINMGGLFLNSNTTQTNRMHTQSKEEDAIKLFIGQVPRTMEEDELLPVMEEFGEVYDLVIIRDKISGTHRGCAFVTFCRRSAAEAAIDKLHNKVTLPPSTNPLQVRPAEGQAGVATSQEHKLFIGMIPKTADELSIRAVFEKYGDIEEVYILRHPTTGQSKGCAFLKYKERSAAISAIEEVNGNVTMEKGTSSLVVKFADSRRQRLQRARTQAANAAAAAAAYWQQLNVGMGGVGGVSGPLPPVPVSSGAPSLPFPQLQQMQHQYLQQIQSFGTGMNPLNPDNTAINNNNNHAAFMYYNPYNSNHNSSNNNLYAQPVSSPPGSSNNFTQHNRRNAPGGPPLSAPGALPSPLSIITTPPTVISHEEGTNSSALSPVSITMDNGVMTPIVNRSGSSQLEGPPGANLFIYHLPHDLTDADLATAFAPFGTVISAKVYMDKNTGESKGFGFVSYDSVQAADAAITSMNGFQIGSKRLKVQHKRVHNEDDVDLENEVERDEYLSFSNENILKDEENNIENDKNNNNLNDIQEQLEHEDEIHLLSQTTSGIHLND